LGFYWEWEDLDECVKKDMVKWVSIGNGLWIELDGGVSYAETVQHMYAWKTDVKGS